MHYWSVQRDKQSTELQARRHCWNISVSWSAHTVNTIPLFIWCTCIIYSLTFSTDHSSHFTITLRHNSPSHPRYGLCNFSFGFLELSRHYKFHAIQWVEINTATATFKLFCIYIKFCVVLYLHKILCCSVFTFRRNLYLKGNWVETISLQLCCDFQSKYFKAHLWYLHYVHNFRQYTRCWFRAGTPQAKTSTMCSYISYTC